MDQEPRTSAPIQVHNPAAVAMTFLERAKLKGKEAEYYAQTYNWLHSIVSGQFQVITTEMFQSIQKELEANKAQIDSLTAELADFQTMDEPESMPVTIDAINPEEDLEDVDSETSE